MRIFYISLVFLVSSIQGLTQEAFDYHDLCEKYKTWFASDTTSWTYEDSLASAAYNDKLFELYKPIKEIFFNGELPYNFIYNIHNYDTSLLLSLLRLYTNSRDEYDKQIGIPIGLAGRLINRDATIIGTVVDKINHYKECRWYTTTYFVRTDSVIFSYFPIKRGDTILIHTNSFGYLGYCQGNGNLSIRTASAGRDYKIGDSNFCFRISHNGYLRHRKLWYRSPKKYLDPFCSNSFILYLDGTLRNCIGDADPKRVLDFVKKIKKWY